MAMRPEVPAPTYTKRPPRLSADTASSTAALIAGRAGLTAAQATSCPSYMAAIMSLVDQESRSTNLGFICSVDILALLAKNDDAQGQTVWPYLSERLLA